MTIAGERPGGGKGVRVQQQVADQPGRLLGFGRLLLEPRGRDRVPTTAGRLGQPPGQSGPLLKASQGDPQGRLKGLALLGEETLGRPSVADSAAVSFQAAVPDLLEDAVAIGTREPRGPTWVVALEGFH